MPNTILFIFYDLGLGGVQTKIIDIINYLYKKHPTVRVHLLLRTRSSFDRGYQIANPHVIIHSYSEESAGRKGPFYFTWYVLSVCFRVRPNSILSFLSPFSLPVLLAKIIFFWRKIRVVINEDVFTSGVAGDYKYRTLNRVGTILFYRLAHSIIVPTFAVKEDLVRNYLMPDAKLVVIPNWTLIKSLQGARKMIYDLVYAGRLEKTKRVSILVKSVEIIKHKCPKIVFLIVGSGSEKDRLQKYVNSHSLSRNIFFRPPTSTVSDYLKKSKIFVFSSQKNAEGFPVSILETMAFGIPVVTSDFFGVSEVIQDGINGFIYRSQPQCIQTCIRLLNNAALRRKIAYRAKKTISEHHSVHNVELYTREMGFIARASAQ